MKVGSTSTSDDGTGRWWERGKGAGYNQQGKEMKEKHLGFWQRNKRGTDGMMRNDAKAHTNLARRLFI